MSKSVQSSFKYFFQRILHRKNRWNTTNRFGKPCIWHLTLISRHSPCKLWLLVWQELVPRCRSCYSLQRILLWPFLRSPHQPLNGPCLPAWDAHRKWNKLMSIRSAHVAAGIVVWRVNAICEYLVRHTHRFIPLHIYSFPTEWEEESNFGTSRENFINVLLQHPVKRKTKQNKLLAAKPFSY